MHVSWNLRNTELPERLKKEAERKINKLAARLSSFQDDLVSLVIALEQVGTKSQYKCTLNLHLPQRTLHAEEVRSEKRSALNNAFDDLLRQEEKLMAKLRREEAWRRETGAGQTAGGGEED
jgi:ribosomal subunit interface protein